MIDTSTTGPGTAQRVAKGLRVAGVRWIDAPVSGGPAGAEKGTLTVMVSCAADGLPVVEPILSVLGKVFHVGEEPGLAQVVKVAKARPRST